MSCYKKFGYVLGMFVSSLIFCLRIISSNKSTEILSHDHCKKMPNVSFIGYNSVLSEIKEKMNIANKSIYITMESVNVTTFRRDLMSTLVSARDRGVSVYPIFYSSQDIISMFSSYGFTNYSVGTGTSQILSIDAIIIDEIVFIIPGFFSSNSTALLFQRTLITDCQPAQKDVIGFINLYLYQQKMGTPVSVYPRELIAKSSAVRPTIIDDSSSMFFFHSPDSIQRPLRISSGRVSEEVFTRTPKRLRVYVETLPKLSLNKKSGTNPSSIYLQLRGLLFSNQTEIDFLVSHVACLKSKQTCAALLSMPKVQLRMYHSGMSGPTFIIADNAVLSYSSFKAFPEVRTYLSLHSYYHSQDVSNYFSDFFDSVWNSSYRMDVKWAF